MISSKSAQRLKEMIQNEFNVEVNVLDNDNNLVSIPGVSKLSENGYVLNDSKVENKTILPVFDDEDPKYYLEWITEVPKEKMLAIQMFARGVIKMETSEWPTGNYFWKHTKLVTNILSKDAAIHHDEIVAFGAELGYRLEHPMAIVVTSLETHYNQCLDMDLGYESATLTAKNDILKRIKSHMYVNKQDLVAFVGGNYLVFLKTFESLDDISKIYKLIDKISEMINDVLKAYRIFQYYIAPGEIIESFHSAHLAYNEAQAYISFAKRFNLSRPLVSYDDLFYHIVFSRLPQKVRVEDIGPKVKRLQTYGREKVDGWIQIFDAYINNDFNIGATAERVYLHRNTVKKRLDQLYEITGYDPLGDLKNVLMTKLILHHYLFECGEK